MIDYEGFTLLPADQVYVKVLHNPLRVIVRSIPFNYGREYKEAILTQSGEPKYYDIGTPRLTSDHPDDGNPIHPLMR
jgi:hypothetical protein